MVFELFIVINLSCYLKFECFHIILSFSIQNLIILFEWDINNS